MPKAFPDIRAALADLADRYERNPAAERLFVEVDYSLFRDPGRLDAFLDGLKAAADAGAVELRYGKRSDRDRIMKAKLADGAALFRHLSRMPGTAEAAAAISPLRGKDVPGWVLRALDDAEASWGRRSKWQGLRPGETSSLASVIRLAVAISGGEHEGMDYRTFSGRVAGDTKALERLEAAVVRFLSFGREMPSGKPREVLSQIGLDRVTQPFFVSGPIAIDGVALPASLHYVAVPHESAPALTLTRRPRCVLTIENWVSFHRHAIEANPKRNDVVIYTGGQPSLPTQRSLQDLNGQISPNVPRFHWSDIDQGGVEIFRTIERLLGPLIPHLMSSELAEKHGCAPSQPLSIRSGQVPGSAISELWDYLAGPDAKCVEQEDLDPAAPNGCPPK